MASAAFQTERVFRFEYVRGEFGECSVTAATEAEAFEELKKKLAAGGISADGWRLENVVDIRHTRLRVVK